jgi:hypothetical protein
LYWHACWFEKAMCGVWYHVYEDGWQERQESPLPPPQPPHPPEIFVPILPPRCCTIHDPGRFTCFPHLLTPTPPLSCFQDLAAHSGAAMPAGLGALDLVDVAPFHHGPTPHPSLVPLLLSLALLYSPSTHQPDVAIPLPSPFSPSRTGLGSSHRRCYARWPRCP